MKYHLSLAAIILCTFQLIAQQQITIEDIYRDHVFHEKSIYSVDWMKDGRYFTSIRSNNLVKTDITSGAEEILVNGTDLGISLDDYTFSNNESQILLMTDKQFIYRRSYTAAYYLYNRQSGSVSKLSEGKQSYATFSPDGSKVAFVRDNNLFYKSLDTGREVQVTTDGEVNKIINGTTDWVYEEEFYLTKAFYWSPDGAMLAYLRFDESEVREYPLQVWNPGQLYPDVYTYKYPKAGEANSIVSVHIYTIDSKQDVTVDTGGETDIYLPRVQWVPGKDLLSVMRINRGQNQMDILHVDANTGKPQVVYHEESDTYIDLNFVDDLHYLEDGKHFILSSEKDGYKHFYLHNLQGELVSQVTKGDWEASSFVGIDENRKKPVLYYLSTEVSPLERHLYEVQLDGKNKKRLTRESGTYSVIMSGDTKYHIRIYSNATTPKVCTLYNTHKNEPVKVLEDNQELKEKIEAYGLSPKRFFTFTVAENVSLNGFEMRPANFDPEKEYPVLVYQYSGPGSQNVINAWGGGHFYWHQFLTQQGYVVVVVDTRGTGGRGAQFKKQTYKKLGDLEVQDLISTAKYLKTLDYVDESRIGIWGWSYGGYMSSLSITKGAAHYQTAIAVAPVTNWRFYDTIYTERYMGKPQDNASGYDDNSPIFFTDLLEGDYLLIHGTGDDNVHFQNAVAMEQALIESGKQFESFYYPDKTHSLSGSDTRVHLFHLMTDFLDQHL